MATTNLQLTEEHLLALISDLKLLHKESAVGTCEQCSDYWPCLTGLVIDKYDVTKVPPAFDRKE